MLDNYADGKYDQKHAVHTCMFQELALEGQEVASPTEEEAFEVIDEADADDMFLDFLKQGEVDVDEMVEELPVKEEEEVVETEERLVNDTEPDENM